MGAVSPRGSYRDAVFAKCKECIFDPCQPGTWRQQVGECASANCPLHALRPKPIGRKV